MSFDFAASTRRLQERGRAYTDQLRRKAEKERIQQQRAAAALAEAQKARRPVQKVDEEAELDRLAAERERNRGVQWSSELQPVLLPASVAESKGLRRADDKIVLPPSVGRSLMDQGAPKNGAMFFEITCPQTGRRTHAGLLEFTGEERTVGLPRAVCLALWGQDKADEFEHLPATARVMVRYTLLQKGSRVILQPLQARFQADLGESVEQMLEGTLKLRSTLTEGDWVDVGNGHLLRVKELYPQPQVSLLDTDLDAEVSASVETEERIRKEEEEAKARKRALELQAEAAEAERKRKEEAENAQQAAAAEALSRRIEAATVLSQGLPPEPEAGLANTTTCLIQFGDGQRRKRRFHLSDTVQTLFDFVESAGAARLPGRYRLVVRYPPRRLRLEAATGHTTLAQCGLHGPHDALLVEPDAET